MRRNPQNLQQKSENCADICKENRIIAQGFAKLAQITENCAGISKNQKKHSDSQNLQTISKIAQEIAKNEKIAQAFAKFAKKSENYREFAKFAQITENCTGISKHQKKPQ